jgi:hypothetical protein
MGKLNTLTIKALTTPGRYADGDGLYLVIKGSGSRSWVLLIQWNGRRREFGLGSAKTVSVKEARQRATDTRRQVEAGWTRQRPNGPHEES